MTQWLLADRRTHLGRGVPIAFSYDGATHAVLMATPDDLEDFAVDFSYTEGIISAPAEIAELAVISVAEGIVLRMWLTGDRSDTFAARRRRFIGPAGCGMCGLESLAEANRAIPMVRDGWHVSRQDIAEAVAALPARQQLNMQTRAAAGRSAATGENYKIVPMILDHPDQWDHEALSEVIAYKGEPKQVWDNTALDGPWLNTMRNSINTQIWSFRHPDFLCTSATHGDAHLAIFDEAMWDKYRFAKLTNGKYQSNSFVQEPPASRQNPADYEAPDGVFSPADNSITVLQRRGAVFMACHNEIWELAAHLIATEVNPDHRSHEALAAELTNHLIPRIVLTPGVGGTLLAVGAATSRLHLWSVTNECTSPSAG